ncbi:hypothetical protein AVEN_240987-1 [Araneus ventricosus]|uniref:Uncharacterized protein n=1 Tax=Araneus ventricosus TaxID=182803 RepID=A0A4Y2SHM8_ARAVE|nr:hypothetical protein AVEN_240987-1 [Araneus ventricosus]
MDQLLQHTLLTPIPEKHHQNRPAFSHRSKLYTTVQSSVQLSFPAIRKGDDPFEESMSHRLFQHTSPHHIRYVFADIQPLAPRSMIDLT